MNNTKRKAKKPKKYVISGGICPEGPKNKYVITESTEYNQSIFIRVCMKLLLGPAATVHCIRARYNEIILY